ncbi:WD repeat and coiled-coil-containing protein-like [Acipenser ruthenus]|uniref:WD repeat and coiled-coil-containing protein-like n=1 Tax=Acipenser ruthenus TaxID=7906 RepID=UPI002741A0A8|nr:WD repeat and coiled-coil-containing protein-like [Acipenser ruthenus]XP_033859806.3 WD repeat and coiled-coil-containing protein-like [Acipenser ruthenus]
MELGKAKLLRVGLNALSQAIHPVHGIAWTDGRQVGLTAIYMVNGEPMFGDANVIGQFEHVLGLFWGPACCTDSPPLLAVQHKKHVTVWQLQLSTLEPNKLLCRQTCEMGEPFPVLSQGCVWHPKKDVLAILTKKDASVLFTVRTDNRRVKADIKASGLIHCACWTKDGTRLVVAIGSALHSYIWNDIQKSLSMCSFCPIFDVGGYICAIESTMDAQVAVATELPLDKICGLNAGIAFDVPTGTETGSLPSQSSVLVVDEDRFFDLRRKSIDSERSLAVSSIASSTSGPLDLTHILANHRKSDPSPLIHLKRRDHATGTGQDSSHLILVTFERKVTTTRKVSIPGILVPDIIAFDPKAHTVAVASNTCNMVLVYSVTSSAMPNIQQIQLQKNERPKGVCFLNDTMLLLLVGKQKSNDPAFLPSSNTDKYIIRLMTKELIYDKESCSSTVSAQSPQSLLDLGVSIPGIKKYFENLSKEDRAVGKELLLPGNTAIQSPSGRRKFIEEVKSEESPVTSVTDLTDKATSSDSSIAIEHFDAEPINRSAGLNMMGMFCSEPSRPSSPRLEAERLNCAPTVPMSNSLPKDKNVEQLSQNLEHLFVRFSEVQQCLSEITDFTRNGKKSSGAYPASSEPPFINITCHKQLSENVFIDERRPVLLCEGKLSLRVVQELFNLSIVEMSHGTLWIVLVADGEGFVPLTFKPKDEIAVRDGRAKTVSLSSYSAKMSQSESPHVAT